MPRYTTGILADAIWEQFPNLLKYGDGNYLNVNEELLKLLKPNERGHYDDKVKLLNHPSHPSRGIFSKDGKYFYMSDKGMENPNLTLFGLADGNDPQATMIYKGGIVLPEITVTKDNNNYIDNTYDLYKFYPDARYLKYLNGGIIQKFQTAGTVLPPELAGMNYANAKRYWEALGDMDPRQKAGILGNIYVESKMDPNAENSLYKGLTQLGKKPPKAGIPARHSWVVSHYGSGGDNELRYVIDYVNGKLVKDSTFGYGSIPYRAGHARTYTVDDSTNLFRKWYEGTTDKSIERRRAARLIYKLFYKQPKPEPLLKVQPLSSILTVPIVEQPDVTLVAKPIPSLPINMNEKK